MRAGRTARPCARWSTSRWSPAAMCCRSQPTPTQSCRSCWRAGPEVRRTFAVAGLLAAAALGLAAFAQPAWRWDLPPGVAPPPGPADNPMSAAKVELARRLFYDADLSIDGTLSCAGCHGQHRAFSESNATYPGV